MGKRSWDTEAARAMYDDGKSDGEIARALGIHRNAVYHWRFVQGLPSNTMPGWPTRESKEAGAKAAVPPPASPPSRPLALPAMKGPVELSVELDGRAFALRAPDLEGAAWIHEYAGRLLEDMRRISGNGKDEEPCTY